MGFTYKINRLFETLECRNADIAVSSGLDASLVSRYRNGARIPKRSEKQLRRLVHGFCVYASEKDMIDRLNAVCGYETSFSETELFSWLTSDLFADKGEGSVVTDKPNKNILDSLIKTFGLTDKELARAAGLDPSYISRMRGNERQLSPESCAAMAISGYVYDRLLQSEKQDEYAAFLSLPPSALLRNREETLIYASRFIFGGSRNEASDAVEGFLLALDSYTADVDPVRESEQPPEDIYLPTEADTLMLRGEDGLKEGFLRFLTEIANRENKVKITVYSDMLNNWLTEDSAYYLRCFRLIRYILRCKECRIKIIHTIVRDTSELFATAANWLPVYFTGHTEVYFHRGQGGGRFSHMIFTAEGRCSLFASNVSGSEGDGMYFFIKNDKGYCKEQLNALLKNSSTLLKFYLPKKYGVMSARMSENAEKPGASKYISPSISLNTMPRSVFTRMMGRSEQEASVLRSAMIQYNLFDRIFTEGLRSGKVTEYAELPVELLYSPLSSISVFTASGELKISYTPDDYGAHISNLIEKLRTEPDYSFVPIHRSPFENICLVAKEGGAAYVIKYGNPGCVVAFEDPILAGTVYGYTKEYERKYRPVVKSREEIIHELSLYTDT